jgi:hypothetical protein
MQKFNVVSVTSLGAIAALMTAGNADAFIIIDSFNTGIGAGGATNQVLTGTIGNSATSALTPSTSTAVTATDIIGTVRDIQMVVPANNGSVTVTTTVDTSTGTLTFLKGNAANRSLTFSTVWDGVGGGFSGNTPNVNPIGLGGIDFTSGGNNAIVFDIVGTNSSPSGASAQITLFNSAGVFATSTVSNIDTLTVATDLIFNFSSFTPTGAFSFANIGAIKFDVIYPAAGSAQSISFNQVLVTAVPFEFSPVLGVSILGGLYTSNRLLKSWQNHLKVNKSKSKV